ncbi:MAG: ABC transporter permease [Alphaproteobacteria bacterium]
MSYIEFIGSIEMGLIYGIVALGVYISFKTLQFPDLTVDGSFPLGACVCASLIIAEISPILATFIATFVGAFFGLITGWLSTRLKILDLLAGILVMTGLYSINLRIMGCKPNISLLNSPTIMQIIFGKMYTSTIANVLVLIFFTIISVFLLYIFLNTRLGLALRATGSNPKMGRAQGINDKKMIELGLCVSNGLIALSGALFAQIQGFADVTMGVGTIIIGLASVIIGEAVFQTHSLLKTILSCVMGAIIYRLSISFALNINHIGLQASDLNLITSVLVVIALIFPSLKQLLRKKFG